MKKMPCGIGINMFHLFGLGQLMLEFLQVSNVYHPLMKIMRWSLMVLLQRQIKDMLCLMKNIEICMLCSMKTMENGTGTNISSDSEN